VGYSLKVLKNLDYFKIKDIIVTEGTPDEFSYLKGRNIFRIDLTEEAKSISRSYPAYKKIRLIKGLPNRIFVDFVRRQPLGLIKLYRYFCVDQDRMLFDLPGEVGQMDLPIILGLETKIFGPKPGKEYNLKELELALNILKEARRNKRLRNHKITAINVANPAGAALVIDAGLEIRIGQGEIGNKIELLGNLLAQVKNDLPNIKYIDLRFNEPVIKLKDK
jgi:cell division septal protein FtsQ